MTNRVGNKNEAQLRGKQERARLVGEASADLRFTGPLPAAGVAAVTIDDPELVRGLPRHPTRPCWS